MTSIFTEDGNAVPVTVIECGPCVVVQRKTSEKDGYEAVQLGYLESKDAAQRQQSQARRKRPSRSRRSQQAHARSLREERRRHADAPPGGIPLGGRRRRAGSRQLSDALTRFSKPATPIKVQGNSKGRGFAGVMKRHGFRGSESQPRSEDSPQAGFQRRDRSGAHLSRRPSSRSHGRDQRDAAWPGSRGNRCRAQFAGRQRCHSRRPGGLVRIEKAK